MRIVCLEWPKSLGHHRFSFNQTSSNCIVSLYWSINFTFFFPLWMQASHELQEENGIFHGLLVETLIGFGVSSDVFWTWLVKDYIRNTSWAGRLTKVIGKDRCWVKALQMPRMYFVMLLYHVDVFHFCLVFFFCTLCIFVVPFLWRR